MYLVHTTFSDEDEAKRAVLTLVEEGLIACGSIGGQGTSIYGWKGSVQSEKEWFVTLKTTEEKFESLAGRLKELHSYEVPEIVAVKVANTSPEYAAWVAESCKE